MLLRVAKRENRTHPINSAMAASLSLNEQTSVRDFAQTLYSHLAATQ